MPVDQTRDPAKPEPKELFDIRQAVQGDVSFITSSWFQSYRKGGCAPEVGFDKFKPGMGELIRALMFDGALYIAHPKGMSEEIAGWICREGSTVHYVYTTLAYRRLGVATLLTSFPFPATQHSHETKAWVKFCGRFGTKFNPFTLMRSKKEK